MSVVIMLLFFMLIVLFVSMIIGAVMFCVDIWKWSKRPDVYKDIKDDLEGVKSDE